MKRLSLILPVALLGTPAFAADVVFQEPPMSPIVMMDPVAGWSGLYVGLQAGYGFGSTGVLVLDPFTPALQGAFAPGFTGEFDDGFVGGAHIGYDWQVGNVVFGGILDINFTDISDRQIGVSLTPATYTIERDLDYLATLRARLGYAFNDQFLAYATGGLAYGDVNFTYTQPGSLATFVTSGGQDRDFGYTVGAGVEAKMTQNVSFGLEYLYTNLGGNDFQANLVNGPFGAPGGPGTDLFGSKNKFDFHTITAKVSYRF